VVQRDRCATNAPADHIGQTVGVRGFGIKNLDIVRYPMGIIPTASPCTLARKSRLYAKHHGRRSQGTTSYPLRQSSSKMKSDPFR